MSVSAWAALEAKSPVVAWSYEPNPLKDDEVEIRVTHCGLCHTDVSFIDNEWGFSNYPMVPGHEVIGIVTKVGEKVDGNRFFEGQRVGLGPQRDSCRSCSTCQRADESACSKPIWTYNSAEGNSFTYGGYASSMRVYHKFLNPIPEAMPSNHAPLLCAGITTYFPFMQHDLGHASKVGIIGIGGLGHIALQYSNAMGYETVAISTSESKREEAKEYGARDFLISKNEDEMKKNAHTFDLLLSTASNNNKVEVLDPYLNLLKPGGTFVLSGVQGINIQASSINLIFNRYKIAGSNIGGTQDMREMLEFSALHKITPKTEVLPFEKVNEALDKVRKGTARYRMVLARE